MHKEEDEKAALSLGCASSKPDSVCCYICFGHSPQRVHHGLFILLPVPGVVQVILRVLALFL